MGLMQQVAAFQESITRKADYDALAKRQIDEIWSSVSMKDDDLTKLPYLTLPEVLVAAAREPRRRRPSFSALLQPFFLLLLTSGEGFSMCC